MPVKPAPRRSRIAALAVATFLCVLPATASAQIAKFPPPQGAETHTVVPGERYMNSGMSRWFLGAGYRELWAMPIEIPVLDLENTHGGLTPVETGGYGQTFTLEFVGGDGLEYAVRSIDKEPTRRLAPELQGTVVAAIVQDQVSAFLPTAALIVDPLLEATGLLYPKHTLVVVPDDPALGEFREEYAGLVGMLTDRPQEGPGDTPGFAGSDKVSGTDNFLEELEEGACNRANAHEYLKARLFDVLIGDRDRHAGQWTWARFPEGEEGCYVWRPIPEDRDQAFIVHDGALMTMFRLARPQQTKFGPGHSNLIGITFNGWELDRQILVELDEPEWATIAEELRVELTDEVIDNAVRRLPEAHYERVGEFIASSLKSRRETLLQIALDYYRLISKQSEIVATDRDELAVFEHLPNNLLRVTIQYQDGPNSSEPYFDRTFYGSVTDEVRLFLMGGDDQVEIRGVEAGIKVRAIGGGGDDTFANLSGASSGMTRFYDDRGDNEYEGSSRVDRRSFERPPSVNLVHQYAQDWGIVRRFIPLVGYSPDLGAELGFVGGIDRFGFRKVPWAVRHELTFQISTVGPEIDASWNTRFREEIGRADLLFHAGYSGGNTLRFHGFGNGTELADDSLIVDGNAFEVDDDFYRVAQRELTVMPALEWSWGRWGQRVDEDEEPEEENRHGFRPEIRLGVGPVLKYADSSSENNDDRFIGIGDAPPFGLGSFGQLGLATWFEIDTRDKAGYPSTGFRLQTAGDYWLNTWDAEGAFGGLSGAVSGFLTPGGARGAPTLATRLGGERVWGNFPFHESAFVGGSKNLRGYHRQRFAGEASLFLNTELRVPLSQFMLLFPTDFGIHGALDVGRVFYDDDPADVGGWHSSFGGGVWLSLFNRTQTVSATLMSGDDFLGFYLRYGFLF